MDEEEKRLQQVYGRTDSLCPNVDIEKDTWCQLEKQFWVDIAEFKQRLAQTRTAAPKRALPTDYLSLSTAVETITASHLTDYFERKRANLCERVSENFSHGC